MKPSIKILLFIIVILNVVDAVIAQQPWIDAYMIYKGLEVFLTKCRGYCDASPSFIILHDYGSNNYREEMVNDSTSVEYANLFEDPLRETKCVFESKYDSRCNGWTEFVFTRKNELTRFLTKDTFNEFDFIFKHVKALRNLKKIPDFPEEYDLSTENSEEMKITLDGRKTVENLSEGKQEANSNEEDDNLLLEWVDIIACIFVIILVAVFILIEIKKHKSKTTAQEGLNESQQLSQISTLVKEQDKYETTTFHDDGDSESD